MRIKGVHLRVITVLFLFVSCNSNGPDFRSLIGKEYQSLNEFGIMKGYAEQVGIMLESLNDKEYGLSYYKKGPIHVIAFERVIRQSNGTTKYFLLDILKINYVGKEQYVKLGLNRLNGENDIAIISIYQYENDVQFFTNIVKAWRANRETEKIEKIDTKGIDCTNEQH